MKNERYYLIGKDINYSLSPWIYKEFDLDYEIKNISDKNELDVFMTGKNFKAINVTNPYKKDVIKYLDEIDPLAEEVGAVNTIVNDNGKLKGYNTDVFGLKKLIEKSGVDFNDKTVLVLGSGGAGKTAQYVAEKLGAKKAVVVSRNGKDNYTNIYWLYKDKAEIIINATPVGKENFPVKSVVDLTRFSHLKGVFDLNYAPLKTELVAKAELMGIPAFGGLYMLVAQAVESAKIYGVRETKTENGFEFALKDIYGELLFDRRNVVLIGMSGSGKTTIGKKLAKKLRRDFIDTDALIEERTGMKTGEYITENGEDRFREIETEIIKDLENLKGKVISVGGGAVLREENVLSLKANGVLICLERDINKLSVKGRPLVTKETLKEVYEKRKPVYDKVKDVTVDNNKKAGDTVRKIIETIKENI